MIQECKTPEKLYEIIEQFLMLPKNKADKASETPPESIENVCKDVKTCILNFRKIYPELPAFPNYNANPTDGLHISMEWCIEAEKVIDEIPTKINLDTLETLINLFGKLKQLPNKFSKTDEELWRQTAQRAEKMVDHFREKKRFYNTDYNYSFRHQDYYNKSKNLRSIIEELSRIAAPKSKSPLLKSFGVLNNSPLLKDEETIWEREHKIKSFWKTVHKIYEYQNSEYAQSLLTLENEIQYLIQEINSLTCEKYFEIYDKLKGLGFKDDLFEKVGRFYSLEAIIETILFNSANTYGTETRESIIDTIIQKLGEIINNAQNFLTKGDKVSSSSIQLLENIFERFGQVEHQLRNRHDNRQTIKIDDEYDVQDLLHALLRLHFDDIRDEEWTPSYAGKSTRMDFLLKKEEIVIEVKKTRSTLKVKEIGSQLIEDIAYYKEHANCKQLLCFVYDTDKFIVNPRGLENDLSKIHDGLDVKVYIRPL